MIVAILLLLFVIWSNYQDIQMIKKYQHERKTRAQQGQARQGQCPPGTDCRVYPWWQHHTGFAHGGFNVGPWNWSRRQFYYHPGVGWYSSPFPM
jgi:hypothetical protein